MNLITLKLILIKKSTNLTHILFLSIRFSIRIFHNKFNKHSTLHFHYTNYHHLKKKKKKKTFSKHIHVLSRTYTSRNLQGIRYKFFQLEQYLSSISKPKGPFHQITILPYIHGSEFWAKTETPSIGWSFLEKPPHFIRIHRCSIESNPVQRGRRVWGTILVSGDNRIPRCI